MAGANAYLRKKQKGMREQFNSMYNTMVIDRSEYSIIRDQ